MRWRLFQALIMMLVLFANIRWQLTDKPMIAGGWGLIAAISATWLVVKYQEAREIGLAAVIRGLRKKT
jgi:hypothetical protein